MFNFLNSPKNAGNSGSEPLEIKNFLGLCPQTTLEILCHWCSTLPPSLLHITNLIVERSASPFHLISPPSLPIYPFTRYSPVFYCYNKINEIKSTSLKHKSQ